MELTLTEDLALFHDTTVRFISSELPAERRRELHGDALGFDRGWWRQAGELGWFTMLVSEDDGGGCVSGEPVVDASIVAEEIGRQLQPGPYIPTNVIASAIATSDDDAQRSTYLPKIMAGETIAAWAYAAIDGNWDEGRGLVAEPSSQGFRLRGCRGFVQDAIGADLYLVVASLGGQPCQFLVPADAVGLVRDDLDCLDLSRRMSNLRFDDVIVDSASVVGAIGCREALERQLDIALALVVAETVGAMDALMNITVDYAKNRTAFGRPIGSFQALKHALADEAMYLEACKAGATAVARAVSRGDEEASVIASMVAAYVADASNQLAQSALQIHGGIGFTWEHDLHLFMRRIRTNAALYGESGWHRERVCRLHHLGEGGE